jgi:hypothetical protein
MWYSDRKSCSTNSPFSYKKKSTISVADPECFWDRIQIRIFFGQDLIFWGPDPDFSWDRIRIPNPYPRLQNKQLINPSGVEKCRRINVNSSTLTFQYIKKSCRPFLSKNFLLQKVGTKLYTEQDPDPDPNFFQGSDPDPVQNRLDPQHCIIFF